LGIWSIYTNGFQISHLKRKKNTGSCPSCPSHELTRRVNWVWPDYYTGRSFNKSRLIQPLDSRLIHQAVPRLITVDIPNFVWIIISPYGIWEKPPCIVSTANWDVSELKYFSFNLSNEIKLSFQLLDGMDMLPPDKR